MDILDPYPQILDHEAIIMYLGRMGNAELFAYLSELLTPQRRERFETVLSQRTRHFVVAIEDLHKEHNISAVMRNCDCFGIQELHIIEDRNPYKVSELVAKGSDKWLDIHRYDHGKNSTTMCIQSLRDRGYRIVATVPRPDAQRLPDFDIQEKAAFFFGEELTGLSQEVLDQADECLVIPMDGFTQSFNISVSAAIILHDLKERLKKSDIPWQLLPEDRLELWIKWAIRSIPSGPQIVARIQEETKAY